MYWNSGDILMPFISFLVSAAINTFHYYWWYLNSKLFNTAVLNPQFGDFIQAPIEDALHHNNTDMSLSNLICTESTRNPLRPWTKHGFVTFAVLCN